jgi:hypothetical protein
MIHSDIMYWRPLSRLTKQKYWSGAMKSILIGVVAAMLGGTAALAADFY